MNFNISEYSSDHEITLKVKKKIQSQINFEYEKLLKENNDKVVEVENELIQSYDQELTSSKQFELACKFDKLPFVVQSEKLLKLIINRITNKNVNKDVLNKISEMRFVSDDLSIILNKLEENVKVVMINKLSIFEITYMLYVNQLFEILKLAIFYKHTNSKKNNIDEYINNIDPEFKRLDGFEIINLSTSDKVKYDFNKEIREWIPESYLFQIPVYTDLFKLKKVKELFKTDIVSIIMFSSDTLPNERLSYLFELITYMRKAEGKHTFLTKTQFIKDPVQGQSGRLFSEYQISTVYNYLK